MSLDSTYNALVKNLRQLFYKLESDTKEFVRKLKEKNIKWWKSKFMLSLSKHIYIYICMYI